MIRRAKVDAGHCKGGHWVEVPNFGDPTRMREQCAKGGKCASVIAALSDASDYCVRFCGAARNPGHGTYDPSEQWLATAVCCTQPPPSGKKVYCGVLWCNKGGDVFKQDPCVLMCAAAHEREHGRQDLWGCPGEIATPGKDNGVQNPEAWGECDAYHTEVDCLVSATKLIEGCAIPPDVQSKIDACANASKFT
jgi:hypothetical protein